MQDEKRLISSEALFEVALELLAENQQAVFNITGMSMWPFLCNGRDQVVIEKFDNSYLKKGDVVLFQTVLGDYILHRVTRLDDEFFESTGDGNCFHDGRFPRKLIKAKVVRYIRKGRSIDINTSFWKVIFWIWVKMYPIRPVLLAILRKLGRIRNPFKEN